MINNDPCCLLIWLFKSMRAVQRFHIMLVCFSTAQKTHFILFVSVESYSWKYFISALSGEFIEKYTLVGHEV